MIKYYIIYYRTEKVFLIRRKTLQEFKKLNENELPQIELYMDQVLTILEQQLKSYKIEPDEKIMTKTMVNNYVKSNLMEKPIKKKYSREHMMQLVMIYYLKSILTFTELDMFFKTAIHQYGNSLEALYRDFIEVHEEVIEETKIKTNELDKKEGRHHLKELMKMIITADVNKRVAEGILKEIKEKNNDIED